MAIPPTHTRWEKAIKPWIGELEKRCQGKIKVVPYFAESLGPQADIYDSVVSGLADIGETPLDRKAGRFPILENVFNLVRPSVVVKDGTSMFNELFLNVPQVQKELKDVKVLYLHLSAPGVIGTSKTPVKKLDDLKGVKMACFGSLSKRLKALGSAPIGMSLPDVYMGLDKGVIDGTVTTYTLLVDRKFADVIHYVTPVSLGYSPFGMVMNKKTWEKLPKPLQSIFEDVNRDAAHSLFNKYWWGEALEAKRKFETSLGGKSYFLPASDLAKMDKIWQEIGKQSIRDMKLDRSAEDWLEGEIGRLEQKYGFLLTTAYGN
jgi:TRAP-type C4-dicarboxylate transport system substrate-binding protein